MSPANYAAQIFIFYHFCSLLFLRFKSKSIFIFLSFVQKRKAKKMSKSDVHSKQREHSKSRIFYFFICLPFQFWVSFLIQLFQLLLAFKIKSGFPFRLLYIYQAEWEPLLKTTNIPIKNKIKKKNHWLFACTPLNFFLTCILRNEFSSPSIELICPFIFY